ncbi:MAG: aldehyde ferredoxin oxidoreductase family protein [Dehalococcoidia bacterium]
MSGFTGRLLVGDLSSGQIREEHPSENLYRQFIGGVGLGVRLVYERQPGNVNPLGEQNILGFFPGLLSGTTVPGSSRLTIVSKSPLTGGWGDASLGGYVGYELKRAGYDGVLLRGISPKPVYLLIRQDKVELRDATHLWGKDTIETEELLRKELGDNRLRVVCIGPAGEKESPISAIMSGGREGRAAARSGLGAVMGSKRLKAIAVRGQNTVPVADEERIHRLRRQFIKDVKETKIKFISTIRDKGTAGITESFVEAGATPIKNWSLIGMDALSEAIPDHEPYGTRINKYVVRKTACAGCPIGCGAMIKLEEHGNEWDRPEYETVAGFGPMCLNNDVASIIKANDICNRYGIDTISASTSIAFAIECYEKGIITKQDTDGIELSWGNSAVIIALLEKLVRREGSGAVLADGTKRAVENIGTKAADCTVNIGRQELGYHDPRQIPARGTGYICDATPGRHTSFLAGRLLEGGGVPGPYPEVWGPKVDFRNYGSKSLAYSGTIKYEQIAASAGICKFIFWQETWPLLDFISAATGWDFSIEEMLMTGERIQTLRQMFNIREGIDPNDLLLPQRVSKPASVGPYKDVPVDFDLLRKQYYKALGWNLETGYPSESRLEELGLQELISTD